MFMELPQPFAIAGVEYYNSKDLMVYNPVFYYGCKSKPRTIIEKKKIPVEEYIYANLKSKEWNISNADCKKAQLLISASWVDSHFFRKERETNEIVPVEPEVNEPEIKEAPEILFLKEEEKFRDTEGNVVEIETRGERNRNKIFFRVKDVMRAFEMPNLDCIIRNENTDYKKDIHYQYFFIKPSVQGDVVKKEIYLTYYGFLRVINISRHSNFFIKNINILNKWIDALINSKYFDNYILRESDKDFSGVVYICSSKLVDAVKIGFWTGSESSLRSRYNMVYGKDLYLLCKNVENVRTTEKEIHQHFKQSNISGELFVKENLHNYIDYFNRIIEYENRVIPEEFETIDEMNIEDEIVLAPSLLFLHENEKFKDPGGNIVDIETRGEKNRHKILFKVKDVSEGFKIPNLNNSLLHKNTSYLKNVDYKFYYIKNEIVKCDTIKKEAFLTYHGLLHVLFSTRNKNVKHFQDWAEDKLFTIQMGNKEEKLELGAEILKISPKTIKSVFSKYAKELPCIYLLKLGAVLQLRETFKIDSSVSDEKCVYKYGFTKDFRRRIGEHESAYGKLPGVKIELTSFQMIDPQYTCKAEADIREECNAYEINLKTEGHNELIIMNETQMTRLKKNYGRIGKEYEGHSAQLKEEIAKLKEEIKGLENEIKTKELQFELQLQKEISEKERYKTLSETNERIYKLEIQNRDLQLQAFNRVTRE